MLQYIITVAVSKAEALPELPVKLANTAPLPSGTLMQDMCSGPALSIAVGAKGSMDITNLILECRRLQLP
eukprot:3369666-Lingulodinium_polyedra.AAC.1